MQGGLDTHHGACGKLAAWSGCQVLAVDYRLAPEHKFPAGLEDCLAAWRWLVANTAMLGADPERLAIGGDSAGGNLAAAVCQALVGGEPAPAAQLLVYPSLDLGWQLPSHRELADAHVLPRIRALWYGDLYLSSLEQAADVRASPLWADDLQGQPAAMIVTAGFDPLLDDGCRYAERLEAAGTIGRRDRDQASWIPERRHSSPYENMTAQGGEPHPVRRLANTLPPPILQTPLPGGFGLATVLPHN